MSSFPFLEPPSQPGDLGHLGHYRVQSELGKGGMGYVFRAEDVKLKRAVALKVMNQRIAATPNSRKRFIHEARAMAAVHHENVATIFEVGESKGTTFMAMEMLRGCTLETQNKSDRRLNYDEIIDFARQMAMGLAAAHEKGIVHRDIKPANIWLQEGTNRVKILDFGLALASSPVDHLAGRGSVVGTPGYLSPEQARSEPLDDRSDLYSLGVVLYELCTGELPIKAKSVPEQLISILAHRPTPIGELNPEIPKPLYDLVHGLLRKEPRMRPASATQLVSELDKVETESHAKSEVAQAINKLQLGLSEVVNKQGEPSLFDVEVVPDQIEDPLAVPAPATPMAAPAAVQALPAMRPKPVSQKALDANHKLQVYLPIAAIVAVVLIALPLLTYTFSGSRRGNQTYLVTDGSSVPPVASAGVIDSPSSSLAAAVNPLDRSAGTGDSQVALGTPNLQREPESRRRGGGTQGNRGAARRGQQENRRSVEVRRAAVDVENNPVDPGRSELDAGRSEVDAGRGAGGNVPSPRDTNQDGDTNSNRAESSKPAAGSASNPEARGGTVQPPTEWNSISSDDGRGADAMVQNGSKQKYGTKPSLGIRTRKGVETNHSYIRFDLADIEATRPWADAAELVLTLVGDKRPVGAVLRVYAVEADMWKESALDWRLSYHSPKGLDGLPLLADLVVDESTDPRDTGMNVVRIASPALAEAIAKSESDLFTIVLAGSAPQDDVMLRFISREKSATAAPKLMVRTPLTPPEKPRSRNRGRR